MSRLCYRNELIGLFGDPVDANPTVIAMNAAFREFKMNFQYLNIKVLPEDLPQAIQSLKVLNMKGAHISAPHQLAVLPYLDAITDIADQIGAVNTIYEYEGKMIGTNTDGIAFIHALNKKGITVAGKHAVILGAGGTAHAVCYELIKNGIESISIVNRTLEHAQTLVEHLKEKSSIPIHYEHWTSNYSIPENTDFLINCTCIGFYPDTSVPDINYYTLKPHTIVCDIISNPLRTHFLARAQACGCRTLDGFSFLIHQASIGFKLWTGMDAPIELMKMALYHEIKS